MGAGPFIKEWGPAIVGVAGGAAKGVASAQGGRQNAATDRARLAEEQRQFNAQFSENQRQYGGNYAQKGFDQNINAQTQYGDRAQSVNRELELLPMRDRASALMQQRMAAPARQTAPRSLAGGTDSLRGGTAPQMPYDLDANRAQAQAYKAGDGGMTGDVQRQLLERYMNVPKSPEMPAAGMSPAEIEARVLEEDGRLVNLPGDMAVGERERLLTLYRLRLQAGRANPGEFPMPARDPNWRPS